MVASFRRKGFFCLYLLFLLTERSSLVQVTGFCHHGHSAAFGVGGGRKLSAEKSNIQRKPILPPPPSPQAEGRRERQEQDPTVLHASSRVYNVGSNLRGIPSDVMDHIQEIRTKLGRKDRTLPMAIRKAKKLRRQERALLRDLNRYRARTLLYLSLEESLKHLDPVADLQEIRRSVTRGSFKAQKTFMKNMKATSKQKKKQPLRMATSAAVTAATTTVTSIRTSMRSSADRARSATFGIQRQLTSDAKRVLPAVRRVRSSIHDTMDAGVTRLKTGAERISKKRQAATMQVQDFLMDAAAELKTQTTLQKLRPTIQRKMFKRTFGRIQRVNGENGFVPVNGEHQKTESPAPYLTIARDEGERSVVTKSAFFMATAIQPPTATKEENVINTAAVVAETEKQGEQEDQTSVENVLDNVTDEAAAIAEDLPDENVTIAQATTHEAASSVNGGEDASPDEDLTSMTIADLAIDNATVAETDAEESFAMVENQPLALQDYVNGDDDGNDAPRDMMIAESSRDTNRSLVAAEALPSAEIEPVTVNGSEDDGKDAPAGDIVVNGTTTNEALVVEENQTTVENVQDFAMNGEGGNDAPHDMMVAEPATDTKESFVEAEDLPSEEILSGTAMSEDHSDAPDNIVVPESASGTNETKVVADPAVVDTVKDTLVNGDGDTVKTDVKASSDEGSSVEVNKLTPTVSTQDVPDTEPAIASHQTVVNGENGLAVLSDQVVRNAVDKAEPPTSDVERFPGVEKKTQEHVLDLSDLNGSTILMERGAQTPYFFADLVSVAPRKQVAP